MGNYFVKIHKWLYPVSWLYGIGVTIRNKLFDWGILRSKSFDLPVICVGNLTVGGTGKTPHTEYLIELLHDQYRTAVVSRGYKRHTRGYVCANTHSNAQTIGDEPYQMYRKFPDITLAVDEDRCHGIEQLLASTTPPIDVILLDDAFQHRYVQPGLSILLTDYHRLFCDDALLPAGRLREPISGKDRAQIIIVTKCPQDIKPIDFNIITKRLQLYPHQSLFFSSFRYGNLQALFPESMDANKAHKEIALSDLSNTEVLLVTGIASPLPILKQLKSCTKQTEILAFGDHHDFTSQDIIQIRRRIKKLNGTQRLIITTEKDATRLMNLPEIDKEIKPLFYVLPVKIEILQNQQDTFNQHIINYVRKNTRNSRFS